MKVGESPRMKEKQHEGRIISKKGKYLEQKGNEDVFNIQSMVLILVHKQLLATCSTHILDGNRKLFWKEVSKMNKGKVESCSKIQDGNEKLTLGEDEVQRI